MDEQQGLTQSVTPFDGKEWCFGHRAKIEDIKLNIQQIMSSHEMPGEIGANVKLAYRHLEDARMRFGKAVQAIDGGTSCYPR